MSSLLAPARRLAAAALAAFLLASCGGGGGAIEPFVPGRLIAFGDDLSALTADGRNYAINSVTADGTRDCKLLPVWVQVVASTYGYGFPECPVGTGDQKAFSRAAAGARVADVVAQIDAVVAAGGFRDKDLVLIMAGMNDILELYGRYPRESRETLLAAARARGITVGLQVDRMVALGAKVIVSTVPDLGLSPFARAEDAAFPKGGRSQLLADLTAELNGRIRVTIINDGRFVGLVLADEFVQTAVASPGSYSLSNARDEACLAAVPPPDCSTLTLKAGANAETWLWADGYRLSTAGHRQIGGQAEVRARNNPF